MISAGEARGVFRALIDRGELARRGVKRGTHVLAELSFRDLVPAIWLPTPELRAEQTQPIPATARRSTTGTCHHSNPAGRRHKRSSVGTFYARNPRLRAGKRASCVNRPDPSNVQPSSDRVDPSTRLRPRRKNVREPTSPVSTATRAPARTPRPGSRTGPRGRVSSAR